MTPEQKRKAHIENSRKGGKAKVPKGFAKMNKKRLHEITSKGGKNNKRKVSK